MDTAVSKPLIEIRGLRKSFGNRVVLAGVDLAIAANGLTVVIGKSGEGKSVLLKHLVGLIRPDAGDVYFEGKGLKTMGRAARRELKSGMSYMFQGMALFDSLNVFDNIALPLRERFRMRESLVRSRVSRKLEELELSDAAGAFVSQLSGGMRKRVALARALVTEPRIVLFDEPTTGLDPLRKRAVFKLVDDSRRRFGFTAVMVSHDIPEVFSIADSVALLDKGRVVFSGTSEEAMRTDHPLMRAFMGSGYEPES